MPELVDEAEAEMRRESPTGGKREIRLYGGDLRDGAREGGQRVERVS
jgi:hypothetical protein